MQNKDHEILMGLSTNLTELKTDMGWVKTMLSNHLLHHRRATYILLSFVGGLVITLGTVVNILQILINVL